MNKELRPQLTELAKGLRKRTWVTAKLTTKAGLSALAGTILPGRSDGLSDSEEVDDEKALESALALVEQLDDLKGLMMKVGQMASYLDPTLPPRARKVLSTLQANSKPMTFESIDQIFMEDFGKSATDLFDRFTTEPFAAASIGQVHEAWQGDQKLAVKVQYPGIRSAITSDLKTVGTLARLGTMTMSLDTKAIFDELRERMAQETDYLSEAAFQSAFAKLLERWPDVSVPAVHEDLSTERILTSGFSPGLSFQSFTDSASQEIKNRAAERIFEVSFSTILKHCLYNADPHPGNYLFDEDGGVTFLDFGCVLEFSPKTIELWKTIANAVMDGDRATFREGTVETGMIIDPDKLDWDHHWKVLQYIYEPYMIPNFTFTQDYVKRSYDLLIWKNPNTKYMTFPKEWLWVNRLQWGLNSVLAHLNATGRFSEIWREAIDSETQPFVVKGEDQLT